MSDPRHDFQLRLEESLLLVIDVQRRLIPAMPQNVYSRTLGTIELLVQSARLLEVPMVVTEQYPLGLGTTVDELQGACGEGAVEKTSFGCCGEPGFLKRLRGLNRSQILVCGMEAHVCVYQTVLGLLSEGYAVHLVRDGVISRGKIDYLNALDLARQAGALVTTAETAIFQLMKDSEHPQFRAISALIKERSAAR